MTEQLRGTVLCAAEAETDRYALGCVFREAGFQVMEAATGGELVRWAVEKPCLILLAGKLGHLDPCEACRYLKSDSAIAAIPVLILFGGPLTRQDRALALESGADDSLGRPFEPAELMARVEAVLQVRQESSELRQRSGLTRTEAEDLLDWLENNGYLHAETAYVEGRGFVVRWQGRPKVDGTPSAPRSFLQLLKRVVSGLWSPAGKRRG